MISKTPGYIFAFCCWSVLSAFLSTTELHAATPFGQVNLPVKQIGALLVVDAPAGLTQVTLESKSGNGWKPLAVKYATPSKKAAKLAALGRAPANRVLFARPKGYTLSQLRAVASDEKFPANFVGGQKSYSRSTDTPSSTGNLSLLAGDTTLNGTLNGTSIVSNSLTSVPAVEPDIWKVIGNRLFFFNQFRGLQVFDISNGQSPVRTGTLRLPAGGEEFFPLDAAGSHLALLGRDQSAEVDPANSYAVFVLAVGGGNPTLVTKLPLHGYATDSRLVGNRLYVACTVWTSTNSQWQQHTELYGFDLSNPEQPVAFDPLFLDGYDAKLQATDQTLLVATSHYSDWYHAKIHVVDISNAQGLPTLSKSLTTKGRIGDKFKFNLAGGTVSAVSFSWDWTAGNSRQTWVETFPLAGSDTTPLAQLHLPEADGETLHATRFDGDRLYVVTFRTVDPLFVVDLSDPAQPAVKGHVEIPGWSTYIQPFGDRLLAVGVENGRVAISLFDVTDASAPSLLSRVPLGVDYSWSEANYDERAVGFFPNEGVLLVPYQTSSAAGWRNATAVLTVDANAVIYKSSIVHEFTARRAALVGNNIISISGQELIIEDATNLSALQLLAQLSISWRVDRVIPFGGTHIIQVEDGDRGFRFYGALLRIGFYSSLDSHAMLRISRADDPDALIEEVEMGPGHVIGTARKGNRLYVGQLVLPTDGSPGFVRTWVFDMSAPPALPEITHVDSTIPTGVNQFDLYNAQVLWPNDTTLAWHLPLQPYWYFWGGPIYLSPVFAVIGGGAILATANLPNVDGTSGGGATLTSASTATGAASAILTSAGAVTSSDSASLTIGIGGYRPINNNIPAVVFPIALENPDSPNPLAAVAISGAANSWGTGASRAFAGGGFLFISYDEDVTSTTTRGPDIPNADSAISVIFPYYARYATKSWLQVLDFRQPGSPVVRDRTCIPGQLLAVSDIDDRGAILLTNRSTGSIYRSLQASAYDGVNAYLVDTFNTDLSYWYTHTSDSGRLFFARSDTPGVTSIGFDASSGHIVTLGSFDCAQLPYDLAVINGYLLASSWGKLDVAEVSSSGALTARAGFDTPQNLWIRVSRAGVDPNAGIWLPEADYGVDFLGFSDLLP